MTPNAVTTNPPDSSAPNPPSPVTRASTAILPPGPKRETITLPCCICGPSAGVAYGFYLGSHTVGACAKCVLWRTLTPEPFYETLYSSGHYHSDFQLERGSPTYADRYHHDRQVAANRFRQSPELQALPHRATILDVGCGNNAFTHEAANLGLTALGLDLAPGHLTWNDIQPDHQCDAVTLWDVLGHARHPVSLLRRCRRALTPDGLLIIDTPDANTPDFGPTWRHMNPREYLWFFTQTHLHTILTSTGFDITRVDSPISGKIAIYARPTTSR